MYLTINIKLDDSQFAYDSAQETTLTLQGALDVLSGMAYGIGETASEGALALVHAEIDRQKQIAAAPEEGDQ